MTGRVVHFEIPCDDAERAQAFYHEAFDWDLTNLSGMDFTLAVTGPTHDEGPTEPGYVNGGLLRRDTHVGPALVIDIADIGWTAYSRDVEGNNLGLWQSA